MIDEWPIWIQTGLSAVKYKKLQEIARTENLVLIKPNTTVSFSSSKNASIHTQSPFFKSMENLEGDIYAK